MKSKTVKYPRLLSGILQGLFFIVTEFLTGKLTLVIAININSSWILGSMAYLSIEAC